MKRGSKDLVIHKGFIFPEDAANPEEAQRAWAFVQEVLQRDLGGQLTSDKQKSLLFMAHRCRNAWRNTHSTRLLELWAARSAGKGDVAGARASLLVLKEIHPEYEPFLGWGLGVFCSVTGLALQTDESVEPYGDMWVDPEEMAQAFQGPRKAEYWGLLEEHAAKDYRKSQAFYYSMVGKGDDVAEGCYDPSEEAERRMEEWQESWPDRAREAYTKAAQEERLAEERRQITDYCHPFEEESEEGEAD